MGTRHIGKTTTKIDLDAEASRPKQKPKQKMTAQDAKDLTAAGIVGASVAVPIIEQVTGD